MNRNRRGFLKGTVWMMCAVAASMCSGSDRSAAGLAEHVIHRSWGLEWPENAMCSIIRCWEAGFIPEVDGRMSKDGVCFAYHDPTWRGRKMSEMSWAEIQKIDIGARKKGGDWRGTRPPSLEEIFKAMAGRPERRLALDYKCIPNDVLYPLVKKHGVERQIYYCAGSYSRILDWRRRVPDAHSVLWFYGGSWKRPDFNDAGECARREAYMKERLDGVAAKNFEGLDLVQMIIFVHPTEPGRFCPSADFLKEQVRRIRAAGKKPLINVWSGGERESSYRDVAALGVDLFGTDYPEVLIRFLNSK